MNIITFITSLFMFNMSGVSNYEVNPLFSITSPFIFNMSGVSNCGVNPLFSITSQSFEPSVPKIGDKVFWTINYNVPENVVAIKSPRNINSGTVNSIIPIEITESDLCDILECPIYPGNYSTIIYMNWSNDIADMKLSLINTWVDENDIELLCYKVLVKGKTNLRGN